MKQTYLNDELIALLIERTEKSDKKESILNYIAEVAEKCANLCKNGENIRVLNEYKFLIDNLRQVLGV